MAEKHDLVGYCSSLTSLAAVYDAVGKETPPLLWEEFHLNAKRLLEILQGEADERKKKNEQV